MIKVTFMGAGSTIFARNVLGDIMATPTLKEVEIALYDIDGARLNESLAMLNHYRLHYREKIWSPADDCRYPGDWRYLPRAAHHTRNV